MCPYCPTGDHSPDSLSFLVWDSSQPTTLFTGDLLFVNDVGRPDLRDAEADPRALAVQLYDSLFNKILAVPGNVKIYPAMERARSVVARSVLRRSPPSKKNC
jgi:hydroxyacylglutathione hydrolase